MNIVVCCKIVPDEQDITVSADHHLSFEKTEYTIGQYDLNAVEAGAQLLETYGGSLTALSVAAGAECDSKMRKSILCRGPEQLRLVADPGLENADAHSTALALAAAIGKLDGFDLVLCGEGSSDLYAQQVGPQLGELLGVPTLNAISSIKMEGDYLVVERSLENETETIEVSLPAVLAVTTDLNIPRIPGMKNILAAGKKPVTEHTAADLGLPLERTLETLDTLAPQLADRKKHLVEGDSPEAVAEFFQAIRAELF